jgi:hypothetical protein
MTSVPAVMVVLTLPMEVAASAAARFENRPVRLRTSVAAFAPVKPLTMAVPKP